MRLTAAMIVRDEALRLPGCLRSLEGLVDEIVVVDTGSRDDSRQIAQGFGARVFDHAWSADFAAARNEALARARGEWLLYIDADERVQPAERARLDPLLGDRRFVACTVLFRPQSGYTRYREYRLFRNDPRIRFTGVIHETMLPGVHEVAAADGLAIAASELAIEHGGYDGDQRAKHRRNVPLLRARLAEDPGHVYSWHHLGRALMALGDGTGAMAAWRRGVDVVRRRPIPAALDSLPYVELLRHQSCTAADAATLLEEALALFPDNRMLAWVRGRHLMAAGRFEEAIPVFEALAAVDAESFCDDRIAYDTRIFGVLAYDSLALCHFRLGHHGESGSWYARAAACAPGDVAYRLRHRLAVHRAGGRP